VNKLGIGLAYQPQLRALIEAVPDEFDYLEIVPDILWTDLGRGAPVRYVEDADGVSFVEHVASTKPVIPHSIGLSIGSAHRFEYEHVEQMARWYERFGFSWHSDHLAFHLSEHEGGEMNVNLTMPVALTREMLAMVTERVLAVRERIPVPFLLENNVYYFVLPGQDFDEAEFLAELCRASGCGLLLDLHNLYVNCRNHGTDPFDFLRGLDLERVVEVHVAGGMEFAGMYLDAHSGACPEPVWDLLAWTVPRCPNLAGVTFELFGSWFDTIGDDGVRSQLARMRHIWTATHPYAAAGPVAVKAAGTVS
jgi:uncharacterized protein (UPF0276 family)